MKSMSLLKLNTKAIIIIYIIIVIIQYIYVYYQSSNLHKIDEDINYNINNKQHIDSLLTIKLNEKINYLNDNKLTFEEWNMYVQKNFLINDTNKNNKQPYYIFIFKKVGDQFICTTHLNKNYEGLSWSSIVESTSGLMEFTPYKVDKDLVNHMYLHKSNGKNKLPHINYYWVDPYTGIVVKKISLHTNWKDKDGVEGVIGVGYNIEDIGNKYSFIYSKAINPYFLFLASAMTILLSLVIYKTGQKSLINNVKTLLFLFIMNLYILQYITQKEQITTIQTEMRKLESIKSNNIILSFLTGVVIFILSKIKGIRNDLYLESGAIFTASIFILLSTQYIFTNYTSIKDITQSRINKQFLFNFGILLNMFIFIGFFIFLGEDIKIFKL